MQNAYVVTGSVADPRTVKLDETLPITAGRVRLTVELLPAESRPALPEVLEAIHRAQRDRGFVPPTREEIDTYLRTERDSWDEA